MSSDIYIPMSIVLSQPGRFQFKAALDGSVWDAALAALDKPVDWEYVESLMTPILECKFGNLDSWKVVNVIINRHGEQAKLHICCGSTFASWLIHWLDDNGYEYTMADDPRKRRRMVIIGDRGCWYTDEEAAELLKECYQCGAQVAWLAPDSRCSACTRLTPEELKGE